MKERTIAAQVKNSEGEIPRTLGTETILPGRFNALRFVGRSPRDGVREAALSSPEGVGGKATPHEVPSGKGGKEVGKNSEVETNVMGVDLLHDHGAVRALKTPRSEGRMKGTSRTNGALEASVENAPKTKLTTREDCGGRGDEARLIRTSENPKGDSA